MKYWCIPLILTIMLAFTSCKAHHDLTYFEDFEGVQSGVLPTAAYNIRIEPEDELSITVTSAVPEATAQYNKPMPSLSNRSNLESTSTARIMSYIVDKNGNISFPVLGEIHVEGMTTLQLRDYLLDKISATVKDPQVAVSLLNFKVNVLGEVRSPRTIHVSSEKFSLFDALAECGDLSDYAKRDGIIVIRQQPDGQTSFQRLDIHDSAITTSPYFYLKQNDVVYVEPNHIKQSNSKYNQYSSYRLSVLTTCVSVASIITSLVIALSK